LCIAALTRSALFSVFSDIGTPSSLDVQEIADQRHRTVSIPPEGSSCYSRVRFRPGRIVESGLPENGSLLYFLCRLNHASSCWYLCWYRQQYKKNFVFNSVGYGTSRLSARGPRLKMLLNFRYRAQHSLESHHPRTDERPDDCRTRDYSDVWHWLVSRRFVSLEER
jgi:hypothetical protein